MLVCFHTIVGFVDAPASTTPMDWLHLFACKLLLCNQTGFLSESNCMGLGGKDFSSQSALSADTKEESIPMHCFPWMISYRCSIVFNISQVRCFNPSSSNISPLSNECYLLFGGSEGRCVAVTLPTILFRLSQWLTLRMPLKLRRR